MLPSKDLVIYFLLLWVSVNDGECQDVEEMFKTLDEMLINTRSFRRPRDHGDASLIWKEYEFGTKAGNREDIVVTNISSYKLFTDMPENIDWQFLQAKTSYFIRTDNSTLFFYKFNQDNLLIEHVISATTEAHILKFKVFNLNFKETFNDNYVDDVMAILYVEFQRKYFLYWYKFDGKTCTLYSIWPIHKQIQDMEFLREKNQRKLLLLDNKNFEGKSLIDVYNFNVDSHNHRIDIQYCQQLFIPKTFDIQICPIFERTMLAFRGVDSIILYASKNEDELCQFKEFEVIKFNKLINFICFESGYIEYLAVGGKESRLFHFFENEFQNNAETDLHFNGSTEISWITAIPLNTYRDESLLLVQLKNSTVITLAWHGSKFKLVPLPNQIMNNFNLSKIVAIPKVGFMQRNILVRIEVTLNELAHPTHDETESMLKARALLEEVFRKQEAVFDETETRLNQSYFKNPVTGFWNLSTVNVSNATIEKHVDYGTVKVGSIDLGIEDISTHVTTNLKKLEEFEAKLEQIYHSKETADLTTINLLSNVELIGDFLVNNTLYAKNVTVVFINNASTSIAVNNIVNSNVHIVNGEKYFSPISTDNLTTLFLNGILLDKIAFDTSINNYSNIDFSKFKHFKVYGHLNFSELNNIHWQNLMKSIVWRDNSVMIPGETIVEGELIAEEADIKNLNHMEYPENYVLINDKSAIYVTSEKYFANLSITHLLGIDTINGIHIDDFIILSKHEILDRKIIFENLQIGGHFQIDGNITGINISNIEDFLNETDRLSSNVIFEHLIIMGNIVLQGSINTKTWSDLNNILLKTDKNAAITGNKQFLNGVTILSNVTITSGQINDHILSEFVTLNTNQHFPYLKKISTNVTFVNVILGIIRKLEDYIINEQDIASHCLDKILWFTKSPIIDDLSFDTLKQTISRTDFFEKLNKTFKEVYFENLILSTLIVDEVLPNTINKINYIDLAKRVLTISTQQNLTGTLIINNIEIDILDVEVINGMLLNELNRSLIYTTSFYHDIFNENTLIKSLRVTGMIMASSINENDIVDIYKKDRMAIVISNENVSIEDLTVTGFVNGLNLSEFIANTVQKIDKNVTFTGKKFFENVTCKFLETQFINEHFVHDILNSDKEQVLTGPIIIRGSITVSKDFNTTGKIGNIYFCDFTDTFKLLEDNSYALRGNFYFIENAFVTKLDVNGPIQGLIFDSFLQTIILQNDIHVTIFGSKLFKSPITFSSVFIIDGSLNDLDLHKFHKSVVYINKSLSIDTKVLFKENIYVQKDLVIKGKLQSSTIVRVDMKDLQENVIALNKPKYFPALKAFNDVTFHTDINVVQINDLQMNQLIPLHTKQLIAVDKLNCINVTSRTIQISGRINAYNMKDIYTNTFMIYGNQNITGYIKILGNVYAYHDFNAYLINNFNPKRIVSIITNDILTGNFIFKTPVVLDKSLRILYLLNGIKPISWQGTAIRATNNMKQIVPRKWKVHGNIHFEENIDGSVFLNGINVVEISTALINEYPQIDDIIEKAYNDVHNVCAWNLGILKCNAVYQIYKFYMFDYLKILEFEGDIHDIRNVELDNLHYMLVNYDICCMKLLLYTTQTNFQVVDEVFDFGLIDKWIFFKSNHALYLHTTAKHTCGRSLNNIWKLENNRLIHVLELDNVTDLYQDVFIAMIHQNLEVIPEDVQSNILEALISYDNETLYSSSDNNSIVLANQSLLYKVQERSSNYTYLRNCFGCSSQLNFRVGIYETEEYIYYDEEVSQDYIFLYKNDILQTRILQTIKARKPKSFLILQFDGFIEILLIFTENNDTIQIYEYRGIEGFVYRNTIKMKVDKLYNFKIKKYTNWEKRHCLAVIYKNRLTILEAKMYGEKLDMRMSTLNSSCYMNMCKVY